MSDPAGAGRLAEIEAALLAAHAARDGPALVGLYREAALLVLPAESDRAAFYLTQAFIFALEAGDARAEELRARLHALGREDGPAP
ncbi:hypothetical protein PSA7680_02505 [Pseudoruegeria aquimaris]|uniref:Tetratricopeptide repeat protein n=1 Tax=Pseudoruegeria aquimaris TaxID=393663 RepID=A0A1Y5SUT4_9RHOB|nr:hypothetical protein [Pseudoruegeria aquimaris]SLN48575.1 hypothetical protein PSA7680_02505 [Pseudoruegeria aquimaris]